MFSTDPYLALDAYQQRSRRLRDAATADATARRATRHGRLRRESWWTLTGRRTGAHGRAPAIP
jgi:hypothetical protein